MLHLSPRVETVFEGLDDAGLVTAAVNTYVIRGRTRHPITRPTARRVARRIGRGPGTAPAATSWATCSSPTHLRAVNLGGAVDRHGGTRRRPNRDGFDFLFFYLYETDAAQHRGGDVVGAAAGADRGLELLVEAAGGRDGSSAETRSTVVADHSQSTVTGTSTRPSRTPSCASSTGGRRSRPEQSDLALAASNRVAMVYGLPGA